MLYGTSALDVFLQRTGSLRTRTAEAGTDVFFASLPSEGIPGDEEVKFAARRTRFAVEELLAPEFAVLAGENLSGDETALFLLRVEEIIPPLILPDPPTTDETPSLRIAAAAAAGSLAGMALLSPLTSVLWGSREAGFFLGAPFGTLALALAAFHLPRNKWLLRSLAALLGLATFREVLTFLGADALFSRGWNLLRKNRTSFSRLLLYPLLLAVILLLGKKELRLDRKIWEKSVKNALSAWIEGVVRTAFFLNRENPLPQVNEEAPLPRLASKILTLEGASEDDLSAGITELAGEVRNLGFEGEGLGLTFLWNEETAKQYDVFGLAEPGDRVKVERSPLLRDGEVESKGLVRKVRRS